MVWYIVQYHKEMAIHGSQTFPHPTKFITCSVSEVVHSALFLASMWRQKASLDKFNSSSSTILRDITFTNTGPRDILQDWQKPSHSTWQVAPILPNTAQYYLQLIGTLINALTSMPPRNFLCAEDVYRNISTTRWLMSPIQPKAQPSRKLEAQ